MSTKSTATWIGSRISADFNFFFCLFSGRRLLFDVSVFQSERDGPSLPPAQKTLLSSLAARVERENKKAQND